MKCTICKGELIMIEISEDQRSQGFFRPTIASLKVRMQCRQCGLKVSFETEDSDVGEIIKGTVMPILEEQRNREE